MASKDIYLRDENRESLKGPLVIGRPSTRGPRSTHLNRHWLWSARKGIVRNPTRRKKEQSHNRASPNLREMMRPRTRRRPSGTLPPIHAPQLCPRVHLHDAINLPVRMSVILSAIHV